MLSERVAAAVANAAAADADAADAADDADAVRSISNGKSTSGYDRYTNTHTPSRSTILIYTQNRSASAMCDASRASQPRGYRGPTPKVATGKVRAVRKEVRNRKHDVASNTITTARSGAGQDTARFNARTVSGTGFPI